MIFSNQFNMFQETPNSNPHAGKSEAELKEEIRLALEAADAIAAKHSQQAHNSTNEAQPGSGSGGQSRPPFSHPGVYANWEIPETD